jgi:putative tryptophan/tyrosine transport system substrate-binding protein
MSASRTVLAAALGLGLLAAPEGAGGQSSGSVRRVGVIHQGGVYAGAVEGLRQGLRELGLEEDRHVVLDIRDTRGDLKGVAAAAKDLERRKVDVIYTVATSVTLAAKGATAQTPIVFFAGTDPVATGLVESLAKPGGRLTGVHSQATDLTPMRLEILKEMVPGLTRVLTVYDPANPVAGEAARLGREAARQLGVQFVERHVRSVEELRRALQTLKPREWDAYFYTADAMVASHASLIIDAARGKRLPTMFHEETLVAKGALASYGTAYREMGRVSAKHVQRILAGASPRDLPVESYDKIELVLNLRTAREIGLAIPPTVRLLADRVIE